MLRIMIQSCPNMQITIGSVQDFGMEYDITRDLCHGTQE